MALSVLAEVGGEERSSPPALAPVVRAIAVALVVAGATASYIYISRQGSAATPYNPLLIALLLVGNLIAGSVVLVLIGRSIARRRAARSPSGGNGQLHVRLVALFSTAATVPMILVVIAASLLFQYSLRSSERAQSMLENSTALVRGTYERQLQQVANQTRVMSQDVAGYLREYPIDSQRFQEGLFFQTSQRELSEAMIMRGGERDPLVVLNPYGRPLQNIVTPDMVEQLKAGAQQITIRFPDRVAALVPLAYEQNTYLYAARVFDEQLATQLKRGDAALADYRALQARSRSYQLRFNAALLLLGLLIVGVAVWIALRIADRLIRPIDELVGAARSVADGDLSARVHETRARDEVGTLARAFNQMTGRLQEQNSALESRRALIEAVMAGVSAGVVASDADRRITIANSSAARLLGADALVGRLLIEVALPLDLLLREGQREAIVQVGEDEPRTLAVRIARGAAGNILTFDDITQQQLDQRRAAWADVARRIAHEIKNPLTPIQLAAERLQRRYGAKVDADDTTFARLTDTIVRQVGDLRRMVDEFSSFARMPKPVFRDEALTDIARQTLFLHEVAHPGIRFALETSDPAPHLVCDRRQIGQALTNLVKNAAEAIEAAGRGQGAVTLTLSASAGGRVQVVVADDGVGLPADRERIIEPYVTTRVRGTGLGLAIVNKIVEEHLGTMTLSDGAHGGTVVTLSFDAAALALMEGEIDPAGVPGEEQLAKLMPIRT